MKSNKVLLGLFAGVLALMGGTMHAQKSNNFVEIGPVNVGGHVTSLLAHRTDATTIYAGSATGGLFILSDNQNVLDKLYAYRGMNVSLGQNHDIWHWVPFRENGKDVALPISCLAQCSDNSIFIGTGNDEYALGTTNAPMSAVGRGIFRFNPETYSFEVIAGTEPQYFNDEFAVVRRLDLLEDQNGMYLFAVTKTGIHRIHRNLDGSWDAPEQIVYGKVDQMLAVRHLGLVFYTIGNQLYKIGNPKAAAHTVRCDNISSTNAAFGGSNTALKIAVAQSDPTYIYVMVINSVGMMDAIYLSRDMQTWRPLSTSTVRVFSASAINGNAVVSGDGRRCGTIFVDNDDPTHIVAGGSTIWSGRSYVPGSYYQWTKSSYCEQEMNFGSYMQTVFGNPSVVHSGIHQIICAPRELYGAYRNVYYIATDGGVYRTYNDFNSYEDMNRGLNAVQVNGIAVSPDASIISGAHNNSCPFIEARSAHDGGQADVEWYDDGTHGNINHDALVLWKDNGCNTAASMFQRYAPTPSRTIFVSSQDNQIGRSFADYMDYTQTQTWTIDKNFLGNQMSKGTNVTYMSLWETDKDTIFRDSISVVIDTLSFVRRYKESLGRYDTMWMNSADFRIDSGDIMTVLSRSQNYYPFDYVFEYDTVAGTRRVDTNSGILITTPTTIRVKNPLQSRMLVISSHSTVTVWTVWMSWRPTDFTKVWDDDANFDKHQFWAGIYVVDTLKPGNKHNVPRAAVMSADGRVVFIAVNDVEAERSMIVRVSGIDTLNYSKSIVSLRDEIQCTPYAGSASTKVHVDTLKASNGNYWMDRSISSMLVDTTEGYERIILTFEGYNPNRANVAILDNPQGAWSLDNLTDIAINDGTDRTILPAYSSMVEATTGNIYVGTADGVWIKDNDGWSQYDHLRGLPVTSLVQQKAKLQARRHISHNGINPEYYVFTRTKWPGAMYFGTYGRGIFMDMTYVTDMTDAVIDESDYTFGIPTVESTAAASVSIFPNPVVGEAHLAISTSEAANAQLRIYDLNGRCVVNRSLGHVAEGEQVFSVSTEGMTKGMYLVNVIIGGHTAATKMMVR